MMENGLAVLADLSKLDEVLKYAEKKVNECIGTFDKQKMVFRIQFILDEIFSNIALYGTIKNSVEVNILIVQNDSGNIMIIIEDNGIPYNPLKADTPDINADIEHRKIGGLGIYLVKKRVDGMRYIFEDGKNKLTLEINVNS